MSKDKTEKSIATIITMLENLTIITHDIQKKLDMQHVTGAEKKAPVKRRMDILTFIKNEYSLDQNFFSAHISADEKAAIIGAIVPPKKSISREEQLKKEAAALWKVAKEKNQRYYTDLKNKAIADQNPDVPDPDGSVKVGAYGRELDDEDEDDE